MCGTAYIPYLVTPPENGRGFLQDADRKMQEDASNPSQKTKGDKMSAENGIFGKMKFFSGKLLSYAKQKRVLPCRMYVIYGQCIQKISPNRWKFSVICHLRVVK